MYRKQKCKPDDRFDFYKPGCGQWEDDKDKETVVKIVIDQKSEGDGGDGGCVAQAEGFAFNVCDNKTDITFPDLNGLVPATEELKKATNEQALPLSNGSGTELNARGGDVYNVNVAIVVLPGNNGDGYGPFPVYNVRANNKNFEIRLDDGPVVNGKRLKEQVLDDGTRILVLNDK